MIGTALVPLADLVRGASIHDRFPIRRLVPGSRQAAESVGTIEIKVTIIDLDMLGV